MMYTPAPTPRDEPKTPCKASCCKTPYGHSTVAVDCTCHEREKDPVYISYGASESLPIDVADMFYPMRCTRCGHVHDAGKVTVVQRYSDCTTWRCPACKSLIDDRPVEWGGSAEKVDKRGLR